VPGDHEPRARAARSRGLEDVAAVAQPRDQAEEAPVRAPRELPRDVAPVQPHANAAGAHPLREHDLDERVAG
jgi:hypothetical protein